MKLKDFITEALSNIVEAVEDADKGHPGRFKIIGIKRDADGTDGNYVEFDVSVTAENKASGKVGGKIKAGGILSVVSASVNSDLDTKTAEQNNHRLKFKIFVSEKG